MMIANQNDERRSEQTQASSVLIMNAHYINDNNDDTSRERIEQFVKDNDQQPNNCKSKSKSAAAAAAPNLNTNQLASRRRMLKQWAFGGQTLSNKFGQVARAISQIILTLLINIVHLLLTKTANKADKKTLRTINTSVNVTDKSVKNKSQARDCDLNQTTASHRNYSER